VLLAEVPSELAGALLKGFFDELLFEDGFSLFSSSMSWTLSLFCTGEAALSTAVSACSFFG
jgi:hypothetical protein